MRKTHRLATIGLAVVATGALVAGATAAGAAPSVTAGDTGGTAQANALTISIGGQTITGSATNALLDLTKLSDATSSQVLTPLFTSPEIHATTSQVPGSDSKSPTNCPSGQIPQLPGITSVSITCGTASAALTSDGGASRALGAEVKLDVSASNVLNTLGLQSGANQAAGGVEQALNGLVQGLSGTPISSLVSSTNDTVQKILNGVLNLDTTARVVIAPALSEVTAAGNTVTSHAHAQGIRIELLPVNGTNATNNLLPNDIAAGQPLITITIGNAEVSKTVTRDGSKAATADATSALATIEFGSPTLAQALGVPSKIEVQGGQQLCVPGLAGTPLETCINVATAGVDAQGNPYADGVSVDLFKGVNGGLHLGTGDTTGTAIAPLVKVSPATTTPDLPRTGGNAALPLIGGGLLAAALVTRRYALGRR